MLKLSTNQKLIFLAPEGMHLLKRSEVVEGASGQHYQTIHTCKFVMYSNKTLCKSLHLLGLSQSPGSELQPVVLYDEEAGALRVKHLTKIAQHGQEVTSGVPVSLRSEGALF